MSGRSRVLDLAMAELEGELTSSPHPSLDDLAAYYRKSLPEAAARVIQDHLVTCRECTAALLDLDELAAEGRTAAPAPPSPENEVAWERLREQLPTLEVEPAPPLPFRPRASRAPVWLWAAAAALLLSTGILGFWVGDLRRSLAELTTPQVNFRVAGLTAGPVRGSGQPKEVRLERGDRQILLVLNPGRETTGFAAFELAMERAGATPFVVRGLEPDAALGGQFTLILFRRTTPDGVYDLTLTGLAADRREVIAQYQLKVANATTR